MDPHDAAPSELPPFELSVDLPAGRVCVAGELDREQAPLVLDALAALSDSPGARWTLDARRVTFCDAEGLRVLVTAHRRAFSRGKELAVLPSPCMHRLVLMVGLDQLLRVPPASAAVLADVAASRRTVRTLASVREHRHPATTPPPEESTG
ncbi:STAS domain-containing protein [Blastococcus xanthinilyticus]|uniref:Anti-anti-sigma factor n=1 Tax=Blastococcus xanthinilyticus TaxID=1564164 RepID=A0A5S5D539_9ACTN|nr:STAS domain-containing protein [Blastococcus xanthinilyticus]TYP90286.1 anti-anti-sigma factor [Blastococcus xanthinilyticus]